jgi:hypothetical protein
MKATRPLLPPGPVPPPRPSAPTAVAVAVRLKVAELVLSAAIYAVRAVGGR